MRALVALFAALVACDGGPHRDRPSEPPIEVERSRRVIEPPVGIVRPLPPHLISAAGVGPYRLGDRLSDLLQQLPSGPRIAVFDIPGVLHRSLISAEEGDSIRIGGEPNGMATFVAILDDKVARTEAGIHVGSTRAELIKAAPLLADPTRAYDPRLAIPSNLRGARMVLDAKDRVVAIVLSADPGTAARTSDGACTRPAAKDTAFGACFTSSAAGELVEVNGSDINVRSAETDKLIAPIRLAANVIFAAPLRADGRDDLVIVTRTDDAQSRTWSVLAYRFEGNKIVKTIEPTALYSVSAANARWIGVELPDIDLLLDLSINGETVEVGGLLTTRADQPDADSPWRDVVVISPVSVVRRHGKPASTPPTDGGMPDSGLLDGQENARAADSDNEQPKP